MTGKKEKHRDSKKISFSSVKCLIIGATAIINYLWDNLSKNVSKKKKKLLGLQEANPIIPEDWTDSDW